MPRALEQDLAESLEQQETIESLRAFIPTHAPVEKTELADTLVRHTGHLKTVSDTVRIVAANAESELAALIAPTPRGRARPRRSSRTSSQRRAAQLWTVTAVANAAGRFRRITGARDGMTALVRALTDHENATTAVAPRKQAA